MRVFVTGGHGFVGAWLLPHLRDQGDEVLAPDAHAVDITDAAAMADALSEARPDAVIHLAGLAHVGQSWDDPDATVQVNTVGTLHVLEAARRVGNPRVLIVSSAEVYGHVQPDQLPITEDAPLLPVSPYAASKAAAELLAVQAHLGHGLPVVRARPFNHVGPGQAPTFAVAAFAQRIVDARRSGAKTLEVGNLSPRRDLTDVRDVVRAYRLLVERGEPGQVYNVASGQDVAIEDVVRRMLDLAGVDLELEVDPSLLRPVDVPVLRGDATRLRQATGWVPEIALDDTLRDVLHAAQAAQKGTAGPA
ncbi:MAG TPA: GDP-mannose 4,6-dehydratase [Acidimicrobiales bacterium]|nr:GDP-mannose 4,6-dehydratase [Acidimicrobiales bacterium]